MKNAAATVSSALGDQKLFGLVNNAGIGLGTSRGVDKDLFNTNVRGPKRVCDNFVPLMDPEKGRIVNVGSGAGPGFVENIRDGSVKRQVINCVTVTVHPAYNAYIIYLDKTVCLIGRF